MAVPLFPRPSSVAVETVRAAVLTEARTWIGSPYRHQASCKGGGCDCLGLLRGIWRALYGLEPQDIPSYTADWAETGGAETLIEAGRTWLQEITLEVAQPGDVLVFRWRDGVPAKHVGILSGPLTESPMLIHAYERVGVLESPLVPAWHRRIAAVFSFPKEGI
ncbi:peptidase P60 [Labrenzia sp. PHM005]|nr:NlpC/P60 family protein [Labrenzia sp. PHM005]QDG79769.1 peptidase P60 [Labrenzia sp. PHM005]